MTLAERCMLALGVRRSLIIERMVSGLRNAGGVGLHLGCGRKYIEGMVNCDKYSELADVALDMTDLSAYQDASIGLIETHHAIEHLGFNDAEAALKEWARVLRTGGYLVVSCPDFGAICWKWIRSTLVGRVADRSAARSYILKMVCGSQENAGMFHRSHYDRRLMREKLESLGFSVVCQLKSYPSRPTPSFVTIAVRVR